MSLTLHTTVAHKNPTSAHILLTHKPLSVPPSPHLHPNPKPHLKLFFSTIQLHPITKVKALSQEPSQTFNTPVRSFNFDGFLSILEIISLTSSVSIVAYVAANGTLYLHGALVGLVWVILVGCTIIGSVIRRRQWDRLRGPRPSVGSGSYLTHRVDKLEEEFRCSVTVIRVLSKQIEKLGTRVRAYRKALKEPIAETAALAQKNSEATRALAAQEDILEKELVEVQKVLLAMQEQQQKQLELILAIGKAGKLWESKPSTDRQDPSEPCNNKSIDGVRNFEMDSIA